MINHDKFSHNRYSWDIDSFIEVYNPLISLLFYLACRISSWVGLALTHPLDIQGPFPSTKNQFVTISILGGIMSISFIFILTITLK